MREAVFLGVVFCALLGLLVCTATSFFFVSDFVAVDFFAAELTGFLLFDFSVLWVFWLHTTLPELLTGATYLQ